MEEVQGGSEDTAKPVDDLSDPSIAGNNSVTGAVECLGSQQEVRIAQPVDNSKEAHHHDAENFEKTGAVGRWLLYGVSALFAGICIFKHLRR